MSHRDRNLTLVTAAAFLFLVLTYNIQMCVPVHKSTTMTNETYVTSYVGSNGQVFSYDRYSPLVFIGGLPHSGNTLIRIILDAHPDLRCTKESRVVSWLLEMKEEWMKYEDEIIRLEGAGVHREVLISALASFALEVIIGRGQLSAPILCSHDPLTVTAAEFLSELFPQAKFIFMVRDGRATVHSIISRKHTYRGFNHSDYRASLQRWDKLMTTKYEQCRLVGSTRCMMVYYEQLVLHPAHWMRRVLAFLDVPWSESVLSYEDHNTNEAVYSKLESSLEEAVIEESLSKWVGKIPDDVVRDMADIAPMLAKLSYDPSANPPNYRSFPYIV